MDMFANSLVPFAVAAVFIVLVSGLWNMLRAGSSGTSQRLMRWRVGLQFLAVCIVMIGLYFGA